VYAVEQARRNHQPVLSQPEHLHSIEEHRRLFGEQTSVAAAADMLQSGQVALIRALRALPFAATLLPAATPVLRLTAALLADETPVLRLTAPVLAAEASVLRVTATLLAAEAGVLRLMAAVLPRARAVADPRIARIDANAGEARSLTAR
jgi:hypothetical protein